MRITLLQYFAHNLAIMVSFLKEGFSYGAVANVWGNDIVLSECSTPVVLLLYIDL